MFIAEIIKQMLLILYISGNYEQKNAYLQTKWSKR